MPTRVEAYARLDVSDCEATFSLGELCCGLCPTGFTHLSAPYLGSSSVGTEEIARDLRDSVPQDSMEPFNTVMAIVDLI